MTRWLLARARPAQAPGTNTRTAARGVSASGEQCHSAKDGIRAIRPRDEALTGNCRELYGWGKGKGTGGEEKVNDWISDRGKEGKE